MLLSHLRLPVCFSKTSKWFINFVKLFIFLCVPRSVCCKINWKQIFCVLFLNSNKNSSVFILLLSYYFHSYSPPKWGHLCYWGLTLLLPVPVAARSKSRFVADVLMRLWVWIPPGAWMFVCYECCVLSGRGLCDVLTTRPEESYRLWCVVVCNPETSWIKRPRPTGGCRAKNKLFCNLLIEKSFSRIIICCGTTVSNSQSSSVATKILLQRCKDGNWWPVNSHAMITVNVFSLVMR
jgi:hypothetical protein